MRVLLLSNLFPPYVQGGAELLAGAIAHELESLGHEVCVLTSAYGLTRPARAGSVWRTLQFAPPVRLDRSQPLWQQLDQPYRYFRRYHCPANARELRRAVAQIAPDVLYIWEITGIGVRSLLNVLPELRLPIVFHLGSYWLLYAHSPGTAHSRLRLRWLKRALIGTVPALISTSMVAVSETVKQEYVRAGFGSERIEVIYNGIGPRFLQTAPRPRMRETPDTPLQLLFVGRLCREKGVLILLHALDLLVHGPDELRLAQALPRLQIIGTGDVGYVSELRTFVRERCLNDLVTFSGSLPPDELIEHYDRAGIVLVPSLWKEPFGLVVAEAMARGCAVIASRIGGPAELLAHGVTGLLTEPGDARALAVAIRQLAADPGLRARLGQAARQAACAHFTIAANAWHVERHLRGAIQEGAPSASSQGEIVVRSPHS